MSLRTPLGLDPLCVPLVTAETSCRTLSRNKIRSWGIAPSYAFVGEPQTNGVIERLFRTLKEQIVYGRIFQTVDDVRDAVRAFAARYNAEWLIEKNGHRSPDDARAAWHDQPFRRAA